MDTCIRNFKVEFKLNTSVRDFNIHEDIIYKPIIINDISVGYITNAVLDESGLYYNCIGRMWDAFIGTEFKVIDDKNVSLNAVCLKYRRSEGR